MFNYKQQQTAAELASILATRLYTTTTNTMVSDVPVVIVGSGAAGSQSASIRIQDQRGDVDMGWDDIIGVRQSVFTTGVAQILVESAGPLPAVVAAFNTVTFASFVADDTVTVNGVIFTGKAVPASAVQFLIGATDEATAKNFATVVNAHTAVAPLQSVSNVVTAVATGDNVLLTSKIPGGAGNKLTLAISAHGSVTAATFASGTGLAGGRYVFDTVVAGNVVVIAAQTLAADAATQDTSKFLVGASDAATAANAVLTIAANTTVNKYVYAVSHGAFLYVIAKVPGNLGNLVTTTGTALRTVADNGTLGGGLGGLLSPIFPQDKVNTLVCECGSRGLKVEFWALPVGTAPVFANIASATQYGEFDIMPYWPLSGRV